MNKEKKTVESSLSNTTGVKITRVGTGNNNDDEYIILAEGDQFPCTRYRETEQGFELRIYGNLEMLDLQGAINKII